MTHKNLPKLIKIPTISNEKGNLSFFDSNNILEFDVKRVYYIYDVPHSIIRGNHAHKKLQQLIIAINGMVEITLDDGNEKQQFTLTKPNEAIYIPAGYYRTLKFHNNAICLACVSENYDESDYIRDYQQFLEWKSNQSF